MKRILIVDDEPALLKIFELEFEDHEELTVHTAQSGSKALILLEEYSFDVIITDLTMPEMDGIQLLSLIRDKKIDISCTIVLSGLPINMHIDKLKELGISKYFEKPYSIDQIINYVDTKCLENP